MPEKDLTRFCPNCGGKIVIKSLKERLGLCDDAWSAIWIVSFVGFFLCLLATIIAYATVSASYREKQHIEEMAKQGVLVENKSSYGLKYSKLSETKEEKKQ